MRVRHVHGGAFVAHVDDADALPRDVIPDRLDMAALQAEDAIDAARLQKSRDPGRAGMLVGVQVLRLAGAPSFIALLLHRPPHAQIACAGRDAGSCRWRCAASRAR